MKIALYFRKIYNTERLFLEEIQEKWNLWEIDATTSKVISFLKILEMSME